MPMANRDNHYEVAFEEYLRSRGIPYVAVDEARRTVLADGGSIKSLDFIVSAPGRPPGWWMSKGGGFPPARSRAQGTTGRTGPPRTILGDGPMGGTVRGGLLCNFRFRL